MFMQHQLRATGGVMITKVLVSVLKLLCLVIYFYDNCESGRVGIIPIFTGEQVSSELKWFPQGHIPWKDRTRSQNLCLMLYAATTLYWRLIPFDTILILLRYHYIFWCHFVSIQEAETMSFISPGFEHIVGSLIVTAVYNRKKKNRQYIRR